MRYSSVQSRTIEATASNHWTDLDEATQRTVSNAIGKLTEVVEKERGERAA